VDCPNEERHTKEGAEGREALMVEKNITERQGDETKWKKSQNRIQSGHRHKRSANRRRRGYLLITRRQNNRRKVIQNRTQEECKW